MKDVAGKEFEVGDRIAYPVRSGSSMWLRLATVRRVDEESSRLYVRPDQASKECYVWSIDRIVIIDRGMT